MRLSCAKYYSIIIYAFIEERYISFIYIMEKYRRIVFLKISIDTSPYEVLYTNHRAEIAGICHGRGHILNYVTARRGGLTNQRPSLM